MTTNGPKIVELLKISSTKRIKKIKKKAIELYTCFVFSLIWRLLLLMTKALAQPGVLPLTCAHAIMVVSVYSQKKRIRSTLTASLFTWDAHVREATQEGFVIVTLTPAR